MIPQQRLFNTDVEPKYLTIKVEDFDRLLPDYKRHSIPPTPAMLKSVGRWGALFPVGLIESKDGKTYKVATGKRRLLAAVQTQRKSVPALAFPYGTKRSQITLMENEIRSSNLLAEWKAVQELIGKTTVEGLSDETGVPIPRLMEILSLQNLIPDLMAAFEAGEIKPRVALKAAKEKPPVQKKILAHFKKHGKLKAKDLEAIRRDARDSAVKSMPASLFAPDEPQDWKGSALARLDEVARLIKDKASTQVIDLVTELAQKISTT